jgi:formylglycine-generating enzyme required for sulfatase activity
MSRIVLSGAVALFVAAGTLAAPAEAVEDSAGQSRVALVIGINDYQNVRKLKLAIPDSSAVADALASDGLKFDVKRLANPSKGEILTAWKEQLGKLKADGDVAVLFYSGHGIEIAGHNYLIPREVPKFEVGNQDPTRLNSIDVQKDILEPLAEKQKSVAATAIVIIDACRENPFAEAAAASAIGLAPLKSLPKSMFVLYSAGVGQLALDGGGKNSIYTKELIEHFKAQAQGKTSLADMAQDLRFQVFLEAKKFKVWNGAAKAYVWHYQTPAYYDQLQSRLSLTGGRVDTVNLQPVGSTLVEEASTKGLSGGDILKECRECPELAVLSPQAFDMGSEASEPGRAASESGKDGRPVRVTLKRAFAIGRYEITRTEWNACVMGSEKLGLAEGCKGLRDVSGSTAGARDRAPLSDVSWHDAQSYVAWINKATGRPKYRLPSEAEWELAARAGDGGRFGFSKIAAAEKQPEEELLCRFANGADPSVGSLISVNTACEDEHGRSAAPAGSFKPNAWGIFDMHGNVAEWVEDCWHGDYQSNKADGGADVSGDCARRVIRGGSWRGGPAALRSAARNAAPPEISRLTLGFRIARDID